ncbi:MAG: orotidine-5'-phosphate decarboxylase [Planctomycetes bacterium]|nr:orotidine-5'-phosphate decarboxylase [Planctomycetota bacterium]
MSDQSHLAADALCAAIVKAGSPVCVGLDPVIENIPEELRARHHETLAAIGEFCRGVIQAVRGVVPAVKFQSACFERYGGKGVVLLEELSIEAARAGLCVVWDAKRGDIGISSAHYAAAAKRMHAHFITVNGYLGESGLSPFLDVGVGVFVLVRTSNPDSDAFQNAKLAGGDTVAAMMARTVASLGRTRMGESGLSAAGAVVGATKAGEGAALRALMPDQIFLIPGYGAQGGTAQDVRSMLRQDRRGVLVTSSRAIIYAKPQVGEPWDQAVARSARAMAAEIAGVVKG